jgi:hypothetical protein
LVVRFSFIDTRGVGHILTEFGRFVLSNPSPFVFLAVGVGHILTARSVSVVPCVPVVFGLPPDALKSIPVGVGHIATFCFNVGRKSSRECAVNPLVPSCALGVGHDPDALTSVRGTNGGRGVQTPFRIEPVLGKVMEDFG